MIVKYILASLPKPAEFKWTFLSLAGKRSLDLKPFLSKNLSKTFITENLNLAQALKSMQLKSRTLLATCLFVMGSGKRFCTIILLLGNNSLVLPRSWFRGFVRNPTPS